MVTAITHFHQTGARTGAATNRRLRWVPVRVHPSTITTAVEVAVEDQFIYLPCRKEDGLKRHTLKLTNRTLMLDGLPHLYILRATVHRLIEADL